MGLLDSLNPINLAKNAAESIVDSVLPDSLKAVGNDLVDVALDVVGGNYGALGKDVGSFLHDAETAMAPLTNLATSLPSTATEPDAPPAASAADSTKTSGAKSSASQSPATSSSTKSAEAPSSDITATDTGSSTGTTENIGTADSTGETALGTTSVVSDGDGSTTTSAAATDGKSKSKSKSTSSSSSSKSKSSSSSSSKSSSSSDAKDVTKFFAQSDTDLMAAVRDGKLPDAVKDDPAAMQRLQLRMNEISEMNQLISQMLAAMHDMNRAVIQNIRA
jgi:hypothetical protein